LFRTPNMVPLTPSHEVKGNAGLSRPRAEGSLRELSQRAAVVSCLTGLAYSTKGITGRASIRFRVIMRPVVLAITACQPGRLGCGGQAISGPWVMVTVQDG